MSKVAEGIFTTSGQVDPLEDDSLYTLAWANLDRMKSLFENAFDKSQLCLEDNLMAMVVQNPMDYILRPEEVGLILLIEKNAGNFTNDIYLK
jgi:hypothetical protein